MTTVTVSEDVWMEVLNERIKSLFDESHQIDYSYHANCILIGDQEESISNEDYVLSKEKYKIISNRIKDIYRRVESLHKMAKESAMTIDG